MGAGRIDSQNKQGMRGLWTVSVLASILILGLFGGLDEAFAETFTSVSSGAYNSPFTWVNEMGDPEAPGPDDDKIISNGVTVTITTDVVNNGLIQVQDKLIINAKLTNNGFFVDPVTKGIRNLGILVISSTGEVQNNGLTGNSGMMTIDEGGKFFNNFAGGNAHFHNEGVGATVTVNGEFTNKGDLHQLIDGIMTISSTGSFITSGVNAVTDNRPGSKINNSNILKIESGEYFDGAVRIVGEGAVVKVFDARGNPDHAGVINITRVGE